MLSLGHSVRRAFGGKSSLVEHRNLSSFVKQETMVEAGLKIRGFITYYSNNR